MSTYTNPKLTAAATPMESGGIVLDVQVTDLSASFIEAAVATGDKIQIGVVPANTVLVPHLSMIEFPTLDASATVEVGDSGTDDSVLASGTVTAAATKLGSNLKTGAKIGSDTDDVPLYLTVGGTVDGFATTGTIKAHLALRPYRADVDA